MKGSFVGSKKKGIDLSGGAFDGPRGPSSAASKPRDAFGVGMRPSNTNMFGNMPAPNKGPRGLTSMMRASQAFNITPIVPMPGNSPMLGGNNGSPTFRIHGGGRNFATGGQVGAGGQNITAGVATPTPMSNEQLQAAVQQFAAQNPEAVAKIQDAIQTALSTGQLTQEQLDMAVQMAVAAAQNPELYPRLRQMAIERGFATEEELPMQYDQSLIFTLLIAGTALQAAPAAAPQKQHAGLTAPQAGQPVANMAAGGEVPNRSGDRAGVSDSVQINVSEGEYVIPAEVVHRKGTDFFDKLIGKDDKGKQA